MRVERVLVGLVAFLAAAAATGALYKWVDEKGRIQYSDKPPATEKGGVELSRGGVVKKTIEGTATPEQKKVQAEEVARRKADEQKAQEQRRQDIALIQSYTTEQEIDLKRDREIQALEAQIGNMQRQIKSVDDRLAEERKRAEALEKGKKPLPDTLKDDIARLTADRTMLARHVAEKRQEVTATRQKYDEHRRRFVELKEKERNGTFSAEPAPAPAKKK